jgi:hypothetical protein
VYKPGVKNFGPMLPFPPVFDKSEDFREFLLTKCMNLRCAFY